MNNFASAHKLDSEWLALPQQGIQAHRRIFHVGNLQNGHANDSFVVAVPSGEMGRVEQVYYEGELALLRLDADGGLVDMRKVNRAHMLLVPGKGSENARLRIAEALAATRASCAGRMGEAASEEALEQAACAELGMPVAVARECLDFQLAYALADAAYARRNGLPCMDGDGNEATPDGIRADTGVDDADGNDDGFGADASPFGFDFSS